MGQDLWLIPLGFAVGVFGTLIGAGGGFVLAPLLLLLYPDDSPAAITSISLAVVFANAFSGSLAYARQGRIDYRSGLLLGAATVPGAIAGALTTYSVPRHLFDVLFGVLLIAASVFLALRPQPRRASPGAPQPHHLKRRLVEADGTTYTWSFDLRLGLGVSLVVGYVSGFLGIGGGILHVPVLAFLLAFPVHIATATSHFILAILAAAGTVVHVAGGAFHTGLHRTVALALGVLLGAPLGALLSERLRGAWILRVLAVALALVGVRVLLQGLGL